MRVLITGGAGFIGSHFTDLLLKSDYSLRTLDKLAPRLHGHDRRRPPDLAGAAELIAEVRDSARRTGDAPCYVSPTHAPSRHDVGHMYFIDEIFAPNAEAPRDLVGPGLEFGRFSGVPEQRLRDLSGPEVAA